MSMTVVQSGPLSLLQDSGRFGAHRLGLTTGGPLDFEAYHYCNALLHNKPGSTVIEISVGGLKLRSDSPTFICLTGAPMPLAINGTDCDTWTVHRIGPGDDIAIGHTPVGCRSYLGVAGGFDVAPYLGSTATVAREGVGGLHGKPLARGDQLPCPVADDLRLLQLPLTQRPRYQNRVTLRVVPGYQVRAFDRIEQRRFFGAAYEVTERADRMGYRLAGPPVRCDSGGIRSEGICFGAVQIPPDGQPIVLLNDRQTIGGYPKIGAVLATDAWRLAQLTRGGTVHFAPITPATARNALQLAQRFALARPLRECGP